MNDENKLLFPSGRTFMRVKKDAKEYRDAHGIKLSAAQNILARENGLDVPWNQVKSKLLELQQAQKTALAQSSSALPIRRDSDNSLNEDHPMNTSNIENGVTFKRADGSTVEMNIHNGLVHRRPDGSIGYTNTYGTRPENPTQADDETPLVEECLDCGAKENLLTIREGDGPMDDTEDRICRSCMNHSEDYGICDYCDSSGEEVAYPEHLLNQNSECQVHAGESEPASEEEAEDLESYLEYWDSH